MIVFSMPKAAEEGELVDVDILLDLEKYFVLVPVDRMNATFLLTV